MPRLYVFDLDGTLAATNHLGAGRRTPAMLLNCSPIEEDLPSSRRWLNVNSQGIDMALVPGATAALGHRTALVTRAPRAYASTLCGLLKLESHLVWASTAESVDQKLKGLAALHGIPPAAVTYIGDTPDDRAAARLAGCDFVHVDEYDGTVADPELDPPDWYAEIGDISGIARHLMDFPEDDREALQSRLSRVARPEHRYCLVQHERQHRLSAHAFVTAGIPPALFRRDEHGHDYFRLLRNLFPLHRTSLPHEKIRNAYYLVEFATSSSSGVSGQHRADPLGRLFSDIKDYRVRNGRLQSGSEVELGSLPFVADVIAAHVVETFDAENPDDRYLVTIDHVAPHPFSAQQPGQVSSWLARWAAEAAEQLSDLFVAGQTVVRTQSLLKPMTSGSDGEDFAVLVDDQRTQGTSIQRHCDTSPQSAYQMALTWSHSRPPSPTGPLRSISHPISGCPWPEANGCPVHRQPKYPMADLSKLARVDDIPF